MFVRYLVLLSEQSLGNIFSFCEVVKGEMYDISHRRYSLRSGRSYYREDTVLRLEASREGSLHNAILNPNDWFLPNIQASEEFDKFIGDLLILNSNLPAVVSSNQVE